MYHNLFILIYLLAQILSTKKGSKFANIIKAFKNPLVKYLSEKNYISLPQLHYREFCCVFFPPKPQPALDFSNLCQSIRPEWFYLYSNVHCSDNWQTDYLYPLCNYYCVFILYWYKLVLYIKDINHLSYAANAFASWQLHFNVLIFSH